PPQPGAPPPPFPADPHDPVPTIGGAMSSGEPVMRAGAYDQRIGPGVFGARPPYGPLGDRPDVLSFATPPLAADLAAGGRSNCVSGSPPTALMPISMPSS